MFKKVLFVTLISSIISTKLIAQVYPQSYFGNPIDTPFVIAGTFGEIRPDHFHTGIDFSTKDRDGLRIYAVADGYVSRIKISADGFGKAIYVTHPNGYVSVYAHLKKYAGEIENYVRSNQYKLESFEVELFPESNEMKVKKGEVIAFSGNTGSSSGAHLHFEIRDAKTEEPLNPLLFGYSVPDKIAPVIKSIRVVPVLMQGMVMTTDTARTFEVSSTNNGTEFRIPELIQVFGKIGFEFNVSDLQVKGGNDLGIYALQFKLNGKVIFGFKYDRLNFNDKRFANAHIDYTAQYDGLGTFQRCFRLSGNKLKIYNVTSNDGYTDFEEDGSHDAELTVQDYNGNTSTLKFTLLSYSSLMQLPFQPLPESDYTLPAEKGFAVHKSELDISIPANALYEPAFFSEKEFAPEKGNYSGRFKIGDPHIPLHTAITVGIKPRTLPEVLRSKAVIVSYNKRGEIRYEGGSWTNEFLSVSTKHFGMFAIAVDTLSPVITLVSAPANSKGSLKIKITDDLSGIKSYRTLIDGKWNRMEYDRKNNMLTADMEALTTGKTHHVELEVKDAVGNAKIYKTDFSY